MLSKHGYPLSKLYMHKKRNLETHTLLISGTKQLNQQLKEELACLKGGSSAEWNLALERNTRRPTFSHFTWRKFTMKEKLATQPASPGGGVDPRGFRLPTQKQETVQSCVQERWQVPSLITSFWAVAYICKEFPVGNSVTLHHI